MFKNIVVPFDGSVPSIEALELALALARAEKGALSICSVVDPVIVVGNTPPSPATEMLLSDAENEARRRIEHAVERAERENIAAHGEMLMGVAADEILGFANRRQGDAIVMGTHGRTGLKRFFLGSVAENVLRHAGCPVVLVREHVPHG